MKKSKNTKKTKPTLKKHFVKYWLHIWVILILVNVAFFYAVKYHAKGQTCFTTDQVSSDNRCLYILSGKVYEMGSRTSPHHGHPCASDVTSTIPSFHTDSPASYLDPSYVGDICTATPTEVPTEVPTEAPTLEPSAVPSPACLGTSCDSTSPTEAQPTETVSTPVPTTNPGNSNNNGNKGGFFAFILALLAALLQFLRNLLGK